MGTSAIDSLAGLRPKVSLAGLSTLEIGGIADWFLEVKTVPSLQHAQAWATGKGLPVLYFGDGSNILFADEGFRGLVLRNRLRGRERSEDEVEVAAGEKLEGVIAWLNKNRLGGMERMYGIPGTIAGALVGNAGAYGQQISDAVVEISVWVENQIKVVPKSELQFGYRHSLFKGWRDAFILKCRLRLKNKRENLQEISDEILEKRLVKYPAGLRSPGSFFKNISLDEISEAALGRIPDDFIMFGKVPAGKLLEAVGARGEFKGGARVADYHGNLIANTGGATCSDVLELAGRYAHKVWERFHVRLAPEILVVNTKGQRRELPGGCDE